MVAMFGLPFSLIMIPIMVLAHLISARLSLWLSVLLKILLMMFVWYWLILLMIFLSAKLLYRKERSIDLKCGNSTLRIGTNNGSSFFVYMPSDADVLSWRKRCADGDVKRVDFIPCGSCLACRLNYARDWQCRILCELPYSSSAYFITFTYDDLSAHVFDGVDYVTGECVTSLSLCKRDVQLFFKRLRKAFPDDDIKYFICGEYGDNTFRPHYHAAVFNLHLSDLKLYSQSYVGDINCRLFRSKKLESIWQNGSCLIGELNSKSAGYISRYILKKQKGSSSALYSARGIEPPFILSSRRPAIGYRYLIDHKDEIFDKGYLLFGTVDGCVRFPVPRYFSSKFPDLILDYEITHDIQIGDYMMSLYDNLKVQQYDCDDLSIAERMSVTADSQLKKIKILKQRSKN